MRKLLSGFSLQILSGLPHFDRLYMAGTIPCCSRHYKLF